MYRKYICREPINYLRFVGVRSALLTARVKNVGYAHASTRQLRSAYLRPASPPTHMVNRPMLRSRRLRGIRPPELRARSIPLPPSHTDNIGSFDPLHSLNMPDQRSSHPCVLFPQYVRI